MVSSAAGEGGDHDEGEADLCRFYAPGIWGWPVTAAYPTSFRPLQASEKCRQGASGSLRGRRLEIAFSLATA